ncbi:MAG: ATP-dependent Clp protease ATP-binding subunit [Sedimentisphaerales bacterium]|nr:ATP-dependent Clp protease ATP-binding subunit [Sedimentisphaerales bacterium]
MYQHLSETAKEVLRLAERFAQRDHKEYVGTEHVLLAIVDHGLGVGAQVLRNCSVSPDMVKDQIVHLIKRSLDETWVLGRLPGTPHFKQVIALAIEEAEKVRDTKVGTEYLLLALLRERGCMAEQALKNLGLSLKVARKEVARLQGRSEPTT